MPTYSHFPVMEEMELQWCPVSVKFWNQISKDLWGCTFKCAGSEQNNSQGIFLGTVYKIIHKGCFWAPVIQSWINICLFDTMSLKDTRKSLCCEACPSVVLLGSEPRGALLWPSGKVEETCSRCQTQHNPLTTEVQKSSSYMKRTANKRTEDMPFKSAEMPQSFHTYRKGGDWC